MSFLEASFTGFVLMIGLFIEKEIGMTKLGGGVMLFALFLALIFTV